MATPLSAQLKRTGLIFSEVYLNGNEPDKSWLEIFNPTTEPLILEKFRFYHVMTTNILPQEIQEKGGIQIAPGECIILCANKSKFDFPLEAKSKLIQVSTMTHFGKGGFFSLATKELGENGEDIFRYGDPEMTSKLKNRIGDFVVQFSKDTQSFTRIKYETAEERFLPNFIRTRPSPGCYMEKGAQNE
jgi:hypothetical protein